MAFEYTQAGDSLAGKVTLVVSTTTTSWPAWRNPSAIDRALLPTQSSPIKRIFIAQHPLAPIRSR
ncbi:Uncharacterised protein [Mycobacteroides abscessus subsp. massiliense]|nr:Uncharacterised protein [Mycobacteroides abscessus subsp. massiliense]